NGSVMLTSPKLDRAKVRIESPPPESSGEPAGSQIFLLDTRVMSVYQSRPARPIEKHPLAEGKRESYPCCLGCLPRHLLPPHPHPSPPPSGERGEQQIPSPPPSGERGEQQVPSPSPSGERGRGEGVMFLEMPCPRVKPSFASMVRPPW